MSQKSRSKQKTKRLFQRVISETLKPHEKLTVSQWAEKYRLLDRGSRFPGKWSNVVTPYLVEIMDAMNDPDIRQIYFCKSTQIGGTEVLINMLGYILMMEPATTMVIYPSDDLAKTVAKLRLRPAFDSIPRIRAMYRENESKEMDMKFSSATLFLRGAGSPSKLASIPARYLFFDEIDKMPGASKKEASPYSLAIERTKTFKGQEKIYACSTPTIRENYIWDLHDKADEVRHYFVKCPHCNTEIELLFQNIRFQEDKEHKMSPYERASDALYICQECGCGIEDIDKPKMLREGRWKAVKKRGVGKPKSVGFWINSLYSNFLKWSDIAEEFLKSKDDPEKLQNFTNSWEGLPWEDERTQTTTSLVLDRQTDVPELVVPEWAEMLTGGVDVQETTFYWSIRAWGKSMTSQGIAHGQALSWSELEMIMNMFYEKQNGDKLQVCLCCVDSGYQPDATYDFCVKNSDWAMPVKGSSNPIQGFYKISKINKAGSRADGMNLAISDGDKYKDAIATRMQRDNGPGAWMVYQGCDERYAEQVTAEHKVTVRAGGRPVQKWVPKKSHIDNHWLDCAVYEFVAADIMGVRFLNLQQDERPEKAVEPAEEKKPSEEGWIQNNENWL